MFHGLSNKFLYSAYRLFCTFKNDQREQIACTGTGFWVITNESTPVLVTNRHVFDVGYAKPEYADFELHQVRVYGKSNDPISGKPDIDVEFTADHSRIKYSDTFENDVACLVNPAVFADGGSSNFNVDHWIAQDLLATKDDFETNFNVCDFLAFPGFPAWHDKVQRRPILRTGTISSDPRYDYSPSSSYAGECVAYEAFSYGGSSGSPVFAVQTGPRPGKGISFPGFRELKLIGINAGHLPAENNTHSGISYMYKSSAIIDMIDSAQLATK